MLLAFTMVLIPLILVERIYNNEIDIQNQISSK